MRNSSEQQAGIEERSRTRFGRTLTASQMPRSHIDGYIRFGNSEGIDLALEALHLADQAELDRMDSHEAWAQAEADLRADQTAAAQEAFEDNAPIQSAGSAWEPW